MNYTPRSTRPYAGYSFAADIAQIVACRAEQVIPAHHAAAPVAATESVDDDSMIEEGDYADTDW